MFGRNQLKPDPYKRIDPKDFDCNKLSRRYFRSHISLEHWQNLPIQQIDRRSNLSLEEFIEQYDKLE